MKIKNILFLPATIAKALYYSILTNKKNLPGIEFERFGRKMGLGLLFKDKESLPLILNPISIVRYFEYDYVKRNLDKELSDTKILDISSPYLFSFYITKKYKTKYFYINPDKRDSSKVRSLAKQSDNNFHAITEEDATQLPYQNEYFDNILSISVIEHINNNGDSSAIVEMWRTLKPNGKLILTFPVKKVFEEEFRENDVYLLDIDQKEGKFFFQRFYDTQAIEERLLSQISNFEILSKEILGEIEKDFFKNYEEKWISNGLFETVKDSYYISKYFKKYDTIKELPGIGVFGITLRKIR